MILKEDRTAISVAQEWLESLGAKVEYQSSSEAEHREWHLRIRHFQGGEWREFHYEGVDKGDIVDLLKAATRWIMESDGL